MASWRRAAVGQLAGLREHPLVALVLVVLALVVLAIGIRQGALGQAVGYLATMLAGALLTEAWAIDRQLPPLPVHRPRAEAGLVLAVLVLALAALGLRVIASVPPLVRLFSVAFPAILLAGVWIVGRYRPAQLGLWPRALWLAPVVVAMIAGVAWLVTGPPHLGEPLDLLLVGLFAATTEELTRLLVQTRLAGHLGTAGAWLLASLVWAGMHAPAWLAQGGEAAELETAIAVVRIAPLGLLWGYLTWRTRSVWPAVLVHAVNVWGLQSF
jgi:membrane protease YdiL (CAAX protease family)